jgi:hypothetical protein
VPNCVDPISLSTYSALVPCGKCLLCKSRISRDWSLRCYHEFLTSGTGIFCTLTYNDLNYKNLNKREIQLFLKRLRIVKKFSYFFVAEYGSRTGRAHYHGLLFGLKNTDINLQDYWNNGFVSQTFLSNPSIRYVTNYVNKDVTWRMMSRNPALGLRWLNTTNFKRELEIFNGCINADLRRQDLPRYYKLKILDTEKYDKFLYKNKKENLKGQLKWLQKNSAKNYTDFIAAHRLAKLQLQKEKIWFIKNQLSYPL